MFPISETRFLAQISLGMRVSLAVLSLASPRVTLLDASMYIIYMTNMYIAIAIAIYLVGCSIFTHSLAYNLLYKL